jgi:hypothetical protein
MRTHGLCLELEKILRVPHLSPHDRWGFGLGRIWKEGLPSKPYVSHRINGKPILVVLRGCTWRCTALRDASSVRRESYDDETLHTVAGPIFMGAGIAAMHYVGWTRCA